MTVYFSLPPKQGVPPSPGHEYEAYWDDVVYLAEGLKALPSSRIRKLPHPTPHWALEASGPRDASAHEMVLLYPAQFWPHKNHVGAVDVLNLLRREMDVPARLVFVGRDAGTMRHVRAYAAGKGLAEFVDRPGFVSEQELAELYRRANALLYLTYFGPENLPPLEAFAMGVPVVASDVAGSEEQLGDAALRVPLGDARAAAIAVARIWTDADLRDELVARGRRRATKYTFQDYARDLHAVFDEFASVRRLWA